MPAPKPISSLAAYGVIEGGRYDGWRYVFERFTRTAGGVLHFHLILGDPAWPFPSKASLTNKDFDRLLPVKGERAPRLETGPLIAQAPIIGRTREEIDKSHDSAKRLRVFRRWLVDEMGQEKVPPHG